MVRTAVLAFAILLAVSSPVLAQDPVTPKKDVREQVLEKLRALEAASRPAPRVKAGEVKDSVPADSTGATAAQDSTAQAVPGEPGPRVEPADSVEVRPDGTVEGADSATASPPANGAALGPRPTSGVLMHADSVTAMLLALQGYVVTEYRAEEARYSKESGKLELVGSPELSRMGQGMKADSLLSFDQATSVMCGYGKPVLEGAGAEPVHSDQVCYDVDRQVGVAMGARTKFTENGTWYVHGTELYTSGTERLYGAATDFTSCDLEEPHYHFAAKEMKIVHDHILVARNVTLNFGDVPVLWLPFMVQSLKQGRRSGLLTPSIGLQHVVRTSSGYQRHIRDIGFFWAINDYLGSTVALEWRSGSYTALEGGLQYRWQRQFLDGNLNFRRYWQADGGTEFALQSSTRWQPGERTSVTVSANYASSSSFVRHNSFDPRELNRSIVSNVGFNHRFDWGSLSVSGNRTQRLSNDQVDMTLPSVSLTFQPVTLFPATGEARWYNNATWSGDVSFSATQRDVNEELLEERGRDRMGLTGRATSRFSMGQFNWTSSLDYKEEVLYPTPDKADTTHHWVTGPDGVPVDSIEVKEFPGVGRDLNQSITWQTSLGYTQRLIGNTTFTPHISMTGGVQLPQSMPAPMAYQRVSLPTRVNFGASLNTNLFGFWPGVGPFSRIRHRLEPSLSYTYSPTPTVTELQRAAFGSTYDALRETNTLSIRVNQTFEAKYRESEGAESADTLVGNTSGEPRRRVQARKVTLLSLSSSAVVYDFTRRKEGEYGLTTESMTHTISSDFLKGLHLTVGHDLFRTDTVGGARNRTFSPRIRSLNTRFSLSGDSWIFRALGLAGSGDAAAAAETDDAEAPELDAEAGVGGSVLPGSIQRTPASFSAKSAAVGTWRADLDYSLNRPPAGVVDGRTEQFLGGTLTFQPTENWSVNWRTRYSFTDGEFSDHVLRLTRDLHRWQANFDFTKTPTGNFMFIFSVNLLDNPDIKLDYDQRSEGLRRR